MAGPNDVDVKFGSSGDDQALAALNRLSDALDKLYNKQPAKTGGAGGIGDLASQAGDLALKLVGIGSAFAGINKVISQLRAEYEAWQQRQDNAANFQVDYGTALTKASWALGVGSDISLDQMNQRLLASAGATGVKASTLALTAESALSSRGSLSADTALKAVEGVARMRPDLANDPASMRGLAEAVLVVQKTFGSGTDESLAGVINVAGASRNSDIESTARYLLPGIAQARSFGNASDKFEDLAALLVGVGSRAEDPSGRLTKTGTINFLKRMKERVAPFIGADGSVQDMFKFLFETDEGLRQRQELLGPLFGGGSGEAELGDFGKNLELQGEASTFIPFVELLRGKNTKVWDEIRAARGKIPGLDQSGVAEMEKSLAEIRRSPAMLASGMRRAIAGESDFQMGGQTPQALVGVLRKDLNEMLKQGGESAFQQWGQGFFDDKAFMAAETNRDVIEVARRRLRTARRHVGLPTDEGVYPRDAELSAEDKRFNAMLDRLDKRFDELVKATEAPKKITVETGGESVPANVETQRGGNTR